MPHEVYNDNINTARGNLHILKLFFLAILLIMPVVFFGGVSQTEASFNRTIFAPILFYPIYYCTAGLIILLFWLYCSLVNRGRIVFKRTALDLPFALLIIYVASRIWTSPSPYFVRTELLKLLLLGGFYYCALNIVSNKKQVKFIIFTLISAYLLVSIYGLINTKLLNNNTVLWLKNLPEYANRLTATYICPNHFAGLLEMTIPFIIAYLVISKMGVKYKALLAIIAIVMITAMFFTLSRGGLASLSAGVITLILASIRKVKIPLIAIVTPAIITAVLLAFLVANTPALYDRVTATWTDEDESIASRRNVWSDTLKMAWGWKMMGSGPGTYENGITRFQHKGFFSQINYAHNDYLQTLAEYGIIGLCIIIIMILVVVSNCGRLLNKVNDNDDFAYIAGYLGAFVAIAVHSVGDFNMRIPANAILMSALTGIVFSIKNYNTKNSKEYIFADLSEIPGRKLYYRSISILFAFILMCIGFTVTVRRYLGDYFHHLAKQEDVSIPNPITGEKEITDEVKQAVVDNYIKAYKIDQENPIHSGSLANIFVYQSRRQIDWNINRTSPASRFEALLALSTGGVDPKQTLERIENAVRYGEISVNGNPLNARYNLVLAKAYDILEGIVTVSEDIPVMGIEQGRFKSAKEYFKLAKNEYLKAIAQHPNSPIYYEAAADFYYRHKEYDEARKNAIKTIELFGTPYKWSFLRSIRLLHNIAIAYTRQGNYKRAMEVMNEASQKIGAPIVGMRIETSKVLVQIADAIIKDGKEEEANVIKGKAIETLIAGAQIYYSQGEYDKAKAMMNRSFKLMTGDLESKKDSPEIKSLLEKIEKKIQPSGTN